MCDKPTLYHSNNTGRKDQHKFIHKLIQWYMFNNRNHKSAVTMLPPDVYFDWHYWTSASLFTY